jgi:hypothetical protein
MKELKDQNARDIHTLVMYVMWSKDIIAGGVNREHAVEALSRIVGYDIDLMKSIANKQKEKENE